MTILEALADENLFGRTLKNGPSWEPWLSFLKAVYGLPMSDQDLKRFHQHTGREEPRPGGYPEAVCVVGCQSGKSVIASIVGTFEAMQAVLSGQRNVYVPLIAQDARSATRTLFGYVRQTVASSPLLKNEVVRETSESVELKGEVTLAVYPCRPASIRGIRAACVIVDELAFFVTSDNRAVDTEMLRAARTRTATTGGKVLILSSPYGASGALWEAHRKNFGVEESPVLVWQASAPQMNPTLPADYLERMEQDDPEAYRSEVLGEFRQGVSNLFDFETLQSCVAAGVRERLPENGITYTAHIDQATGSGRDSFCLAISHDDGGRSILDLCRRWAPPFTPSTVIQECADVLRKFRLTETSGDRHAENFIVDGFQKCGITFRRSELTTIQTYLEFLPMVNSNIVLLLDQSILLKELRGLQRSRGTGGRDRVDHRPGQHDDMAAACAGALVKSARAESQEPFMWNFLTGEILHSEPE